MYTLMQSIPDTEGATLTTVRMRRSRSLPDVLEDGRGDTKERGWESRLVDYGYVETQRHTEQPGTYRYHGFRVASEGRVLVLLSFTFFAAPFSAVLLPLFALEICSRIAPAGAYDALSAFAPVYLQWMASVAVCTVVVCVAAFVVYSRGAGLPTPRNMERLVEWGVPAFILEGTVVSVIAFMVKRGALFSAGLIGWRALSFIIVQLDLAALWIGGWLLWVGVRLGIGQFSVLAKSASSSPGMRGCVAVEDLV